ncbi:hypothetical protein C8R45DRAFT_1083007 [Mycena sanguinolenta]|nr:hypothetical protein C8R45DRAFT_1083007 [Mycena sanguinolenta]
MQCIPNREIIFGTFGRGVLHIDDRSSTLKVGLSSANQERAVLFDEGGGVAAELRRESLRGLRQPSKRADCYAHLDGTTLERWRTNSAKARHRKANLHTRMRHQSRQAEQFKSTVVDVGRTIILGARGVCNRFEAGDARRAEEREWPGTASSSRLKNLVYALGCTEFATMSVFSAKTMARIAVIPSQFDSSGWASVRPELVRVHQCLAGLGQLATHRAIPPDWHTALHLKSRAFEELILGAGGTWTDLASLVVAHIKRALLHPNSSVTHQTILQIFSIISILSRDEEHDLLSPGIVAALTTVAQHLCRSTVAHVGMGLTGLLTALTDSMRMLPAEWLLESLRAELLDILFTSKHRESSSFRPPYRSVLVSLRTFFAQAPNHDPATIFGDAHLLAHWNRLVSVVVHRCQLAEQYSAGVLNVPRVCDDLECAKLRSRQDFKCCSGCMSAYYCSSACQANDWRHGGHRQICPVFALRRKQFFRIPSGDQSFLRARAHHEFLTLRDEILDKYDLFERNDPCEEPVILADYVTDEIAFGLDVDRATRGGGKLLLYFMKVMDGPKPPLWPFHLHLNSVVELDGMSVALPGMRRMEDDGGESHVFFLAHFLSLDVFGYNTRRAFVHLLDGATRVSISAIRSRFGGAAPRLALLKRADES